jgi:catechol 2,3-dioxygenase-like lactoylglutathione lyase family enzyme
VRVEQVDFITVPTRDIERASAFYTEALGLPASEKSEAEVETPNLTLSFWNPEEEGEKFFTNSDVESAVDEVRAAGGEIMGSVDTGVCHMGFVKDPDGNTAILHRRYAPHG